MYFPGQSNCTGSVILPSRVFIFQITYAVLGVISYAVFHVLLNLDFVPVLTTLSGASTEVKAERDHDFSGNMPRSCIIAVLGCVNQVINLRSQLNNLFSA